MKYLRYLILACFAFSFAQLHAQTDSSFLSKTASLLNKQLISNPTEKVYLHLDRPSYSLGDTIWFKAYAVSGAGHKPSDISGVLHVELISPIDSVLKRINLQLDAGVTWGDFTIASSYAPGTYRLRAYTNWMRNKPCPAFYDQKIRIGKLALLTEEANKNIINPDVQFFPEGGQLINGLRSKVAIKAVSKNGSGEDVSGTITDNEGNEVAAFNTQHLGMGIFALTPQTGKTYKAKIKDSQGHAFEVDLSKAQSDGFVLTVNNRLADSINIKVNSAPATFTAKQHSRYYLIGEANGQVYYTTFFNLDEPAYIMRISKHRFPSGICRFTLFSQNGEPLNERIAFISKNDTLKLNIDLPDQKFTARQKIAVNVLATDYGNNPVSGSFSVAVINESRVGVNEDEESTILNNLLLTSELKGYIEKPNYYFTNVTDQKRDDLDMLMLTQGYRSFEWKQLLSDKPLLTTYPAEQALQLEGSIKTPSGKPLPMGKVSLFASRENFYRDTTADINGNFKFTNVEISDTAKIVVQARKQNNGKNVSIFVKQPDFAKVDKRTNYKEPDAVLAGTFGKQPNDTNLAQAAAPKDSLKIKEVIIKGKKKAKDDNLDNYGTYEQRLVDMKRVHNKVYLSLEEALREIEPETKVSYFGSHLSNGNAINSVVEPENEGKVIVDGAWRDRYSLSVFYPQEIENVRLVFKPNSNKPLIIVTTRKYAGTDTTTLKQVNIRSTRLNKKPDMSQSSNLNGAGNADQVIMGDKLLKSCARLSDCLLGKIFGVSFDAEGNPINDRSRKKMSVIINGNIIPGDALNSVNVNDVYSIEVLRGQSYTLIYGSGMSAGALVITTNPGVGNFVTSESPSGLISYPFKGYYKARVFYSPKYSTPKSNNDTPDLRSTIYWNPNIITDEKGKTSFDYFNADTKGTYRIVIEGIDGFGNLGRQVYRYKVE